MLQYESDACLLHINRLIAFELVSCRLLTLRHADKDFFLSNFCPKIRFFDISGLFFTIACILVENMLFSLLLQGLQHNLGFATRRRFAFGGVVV